MSEIAVGYPKFTNDMGVTEIRIGVKEFECVGALPPHDHPHIYLDMGDGDRIHCPYCNTVYVYDPSLGRLESEPRDAFFEVSGADPR